MEVQINNAEKETYCLVDDNFNIIMITDNYEEIYDDIYDSSKLPVNKSPKTDFFILQVIKKVTCSINIQDL